MAAGCQKYICNSSQSACTLTKEAFHMFKKNTRKRLLAGALATVMMLTMCPSWALADAEDIAAPLPLVDENRSVAESTPVEADTTKTPAVPTPSETEAKPAEGQDTAPAPSDDGANGGTDSTETGNSTNPTISEGSENNSQKNNVVSSSPDVNDQPQDAADINDTSMASLDAVPYGWNDVKTIEAEYWITNLHAVGEDGSWKLKIASNCDGITSDNGLAITDIVPNERAATTTGGSYNTVFWQARVQHISPQTTLPNDDKTQDGTEITRIRYKDGEFECCAKDSSEKGSSKWTKFNPWIDQLVFYYLIRTEYFQMVQIDVSDWTVDKEDTLHPKRRSVTYQVIVKGGDDDGNDKLVASQQFWYNKALKVSSVRVRQTESEHYTIEDVVLEPNNLGDPPKNENGEYRFSLDLNQIKAKNNATVKIYVSATSHELNYDTNGGTLKDGSYSKGKVYPEVELKLPTDAEITRTGYTFGGWYDEVNHKPYQTGDPMPNDDLTLKAHWTAKTPVTPPVEPETNTPAKYFVLLPNCGKPESSASQGWTSYLPNETSDGGVMDLTRETGYKGSLKPEGKAVADAGGTFSATGVDPSYLDPPTDLGFFTASNWSGSTYIAKTKHKSEEIKNLLQTAKGDFDVTKVQVVWYTVKYESTDGYHVDGYVAGVPITVTYHSNDSAISGAAETTSVKDATSGKEYTVLQNMFTVPNGYEFGGWYTDAACTKGNEVEVGFDKLLMDSWNLYAKWVPKKFDVSYFVDNEQYGETEEYAVDTDVTVRTAHPEKAGYTFTGWTPAADVANIIKIDDNGHFIMPAQPVRFDAQFRINRYNVTYKVGTEVVGTEVYNFNSDVVIRDVPTKEGYTFSGWKIGNADAKNFKMPADNVVIEGTFAKNSSGGHHHRRPTVTIPDDVPTGLNGNDHYAYIVGYPDKTVRPQNGITRAEVATIFFRLLTDETRNANSTKSNSYSDVAAGAWYNHAVSTLSAMGIVKGDSDGKFNPNAPITRAEFAAIAARFDDKANTTTADFSDIASHWAKNEISAASNNGWINGYPDGTFRPDAAVTRAQFVLMLWRMCGKPAAAKAASFADASADWYQDALSWAVEKGYVNGLSDTRFGPDAPITRQQATAILFRL